MIRLRSNSTGSSGPGVRWQAFLEISNFDSQQLCSPIIYRAQIFSIKRSNLFKNCVKISREQQRFKGRIYLVKVTSFHIINWALLILNVAPLYFPDHKSSKKNDPLRNIMFIQVKKFMNGRGANMRGNICSLQIFAKLGPLLWAYFQSFNNILYLKRPFLFEDL